MKFAKALICLLWMILSVGACKGQPAGSIAVPPHPRELRDTLSILIVGDIMCHGAQVKNAFALYEKEHPGASRNEADAYDWSRSFRGIEAWIRQADIAVGNMEFPFAGPPYLGYPAFSAPDSYLDYITGIGFDLLLAANNHILDQGKRGIERTIRLYDEMEANSHVRYTGIAASAEADSLRYPLFLESKGLRLAFVNFTYGTNTSLASTYPKVNRQQRSDIKEALRRAREGGADYIIVLPHWGVEYARHHSDEQERLADWLIENGADAIVGAHPHRVQDMDIREVPLATDTSARRLVPIFYSIGNAVSNQNDPEGRLELCVTLRIVRNSQGKSRMIEPLRQFVWCTKPGMITDGYTVIPVKDYLGRPEAWQAVPGDYGTMVATYEKVKKNTLIVDE